MDLALEISPLQVHRLASDLRLRGVNVTLARAELMVDALSLFKGLTVEEAFWLGRATLCCDRSEFAAYDQCFSALFNNGKLLPYDQIRAGSEGEHRSDRRNQTTRPVGEQESSLAIREGGASSVHAAVHAPDDSDTQENSHSTPPVDGAGATDGDVIRSEDFSLLTGAERSEVLTMMGAMSSSFPRRMSRRRASSRFGSIDMSRTVASAMAHAGDPERLFRQRRVLRPRRCIVLIDVSGSMASYSQLLLRLGYALVQSQPRSTEVFTIGTRLTRATRFLQTRDPDVALPRATSAVPDWLGGTRLGEQLKAFLDLWGQRGMARGAQVLIASDGWERGDCSLLTEQMQRLRRLAFRIIWCNPHKGTLGYEPTSRGIRAVLPYVDNFLAGASLEDMQNVVAFISSGLDRRAKPARHHVTSRFRRAS